MNEVLRKIKGSTHLAAAHNARISPSANCTVRLFGCPRTLSKRSITLSTSNVVVMLVMLKP